MFSTDRFHMTLNTVVTRSVFDWRAEPAQPTEREILLQKKRTYQAARRLRILANRTNAHSDVGRSTTGEKTARILSGYPHGN
jgi:hypothetical protein